MKLIPIWSAVDFRNGLNDLTEALAHIRVVCGQLLQGVHLLRHRELVHKVDEGQEDARGFGKVVVGFNSRAEEEFACIKSTCRLLRGLV